MNFDKDVFFKYLNEKDYVSCMDMLRQEIVEAPRGEITDRNGVILATFYNRSICENIDIFA